MTLGTAPRQGDLLRTTVNYCSGRVDEDSIYGVLHRECFRLFPDEMFADLFTDVGRRSVPPMIVAAAVPRSGNPARTRPSLPRPNDGSGPFTASRVGGGAALSGVRLGRRMRRR